MHDTTTPAPANWWDKAITLGSGTVAEATIHSAADMARDLLDHIQRPDITPELRRRVHDLAELLGVLAEWAPIEAFTTDVPGPTRKSCDCGSYRHREDGMWICINPNCEYDK